MLHDRRHEIEIKLKFTYLVKKKGDMKHVSLAGCMTGIFLKYFSSRISAIFLETFQNTSRSLPKFFRDFPKKILEIFQNITQNVLRKNFSKFSLTFALVSKLRRSFTTL